MKTLFVLSLLHEPPGDNAATRLFRGRPVLSWTLDRLAQVTRLPDPTPTAVACWADQLDAVQAVFGDRKFIHLNVGDRITIPTVQAVAAAQRWADGWRGGLLATCWFDRGFHAPSVLAGLNAAAADAAILIDPAAALVDPALIDALLTQANAHPDRDLIFSPAAPGLAGILLRRPAVADLAKRSTHPGRSLHYLPDVYGGDPIATPACAPAPTPACRTLRRFTLDSDQDIHRLERLTAPLNGTLLRTGAERLVALADADTDLPPLPRDLRLELTTQRATRAIFRPQDLTRRELPPAEWTAWHSQLASASAQPTRITLAGAGDPLLYDGVADVIAAAHAAGFPVAVETDLVSIPPDRIEALAASRADLVLVHIPAVTAKTYAAVMGADALPELLANMQRFLTARARSALPLLVPCFVKTSLNAAEMEPWYDHWLKLVGSAVIEGATDYAGQIKDVSVARMDPSTRVPCRRLTSRMQVLSDGTAAPCELDVHALTNAGNVLRDGLAHAWHDGLAPLRETHRQGRYSLNVTNSLCSNCKEWHRP